MTTQSEMLADFRAKLSVWMDEAEREYRAIMYRKEVLTLFKETGMIMYRLMEMEMDNKTGIIQSEMWFYASIFNS